MFPDVKSKFEIFFVVVTSEFEREILILIIIILWLVFASAGLPLTELKLHEVNLKAITGNTQCSKH